MTLATCPKNEYCTDCLEHSALNMTAHILTLKSTEMIPKVKQNKLQVKSDLTIKDDNSKF